MILKKTPFEKGLAPDLCTVVDELYSRMSSRVRWQGECSESFVINQGTRRGRILPPHLYKMYVNPVLEDLKRNTLGAHIDTIYTDCLSVADDFLLLSNCPEELQVTFNLGRGFAGEPRYKLKTKLVSRVSTKTSRIKDRNKKWNSLLVKRQNDNTSPGLGQERLVPSSHKGSEFRYKVVRQFSGGDERIREVIPVPDSLGKDAFLICVFTNRGNLKSHWMLISAMPVFFLFFFFFGGGGGDKVNYRNSGFTF